MLLGRKQPHELRLTMLNPAGMTPDDHAFVELLRKYPPRSGLKSGDICELINLPPSYAGQGPFPNFWEVRATYSRWQLRLHDFVQKHGAWRIDWAVAQIEAMRMSRFDDEDSLMPPKYTDSFIYAHAFPHGEWPSSAMWIPEWCLRKTPLIAPTEAWEPILDEFSSPFVGYDESKFGAGVVLDLAPDVYGDQRTRTRPLSFEEGAFHLACLLGLEERCMVPSVSADEIYQNAQENEERWR